MILASCYSPTRLLALSSAEINCAVEGEYKLMDIEEAVYLLLAIIVGLAADLMLFHPLTAIIGQFVTLNALLVLLVPVILAVALFGAIGLALRLPKLALGAAVGIVILSELWTFLAGIQYGQLAFGILLALGLFSLGFKPIAEALGK